MAAGRTVRVLAASMLLIGPALAAERPALDVPVHAGGEAELDACAASGAVAGLDPKDDNFLSVRSGPGGRPYREIDRTHTGQRVTICEEHGPWLGVVYPEKEGEDCKVSSPQAKRTVYDGPCRAGWVHGRYIGDRAG